MRIKLDENIPARLTGILSSFGHDVDSVEDEGLRGRDDRSVWRAAVSEGRLLITPDMDFSDIRAYPPAAGGGILLVRLRNATQRALIDRIESLFASADVETWAGCAVVASERKLRVRRVGQ
ncbi:MAG: DUF5615 family PIN-like protein [Candidatus Hydrogenedentes bacterium]|nr:DUF5615 family PIN-like protein [Candidatus Hydrogenedentota bacterium]